MEKVLKDEHMKVVRMRLPTRIERPSTNRWGRLWQRIRCRMGNLQIRHSELPFHLLLLQADDKFFRLLCMPYTCDILQQREIKIIKSFRQLSETEEKGTVSVYLGKRLEYRVRWSLTWSDDGLDLNAAVPVPLLCPLILEPSQLWFFGSDNVS